MINAITVTINSSISKLKINFVLLIPIALKTPISYFLSLMLRILITAKMIAPTINMIIRNVIEKLLIFLIGVKVLVISSVLSVILQRSPDIFYHSLLTPNVARPGLWLYFC